MFSESRVDLVGKDLFGKDLECSRFFFRFFFAQCQGFYPVTIWNVLD